MKLRTGLGAGAYFHTALHKDECSVWVKAQRLRHHPGHPALSSNARARLHQLRQFGRNIHVRTRCSAAHLAQPLCTRPHEASITNAGTKERITSSQPCSLLRGILHHNNPAKHQYTQHVTKPAPIPLIATNKEFARSRYPANLDCQSVTRLLACCAC